jgi:glutaminyl-peptide cyclotransferase
MKCHIGRHKWRLYLALLTTLVLFISLASASAQTCPCPAEPIVPERLTVEVLNEFPHDSGSFTQGLLVLDGTFYESAGQYGQSDVRQVEIETGEILRKVELNAEFFAEGLTFVPGSADGTTQDRLIQLTWQENMAIVWSPTTLEVVGTFLYETQGWGICYDGTRLLMSDGTSNLYVRDAQTFQLRAMIPVTLEGEPVLNLNELECVGDEVYANIWQTDTIVRIDAASGVVTGVIDAASLLTPEERATLEGGAVLNGIAFNVEAETFYITGKLWSSVFEVRFVSEGS